MRNIEPCMCGDTECFYCGSAQGTWSGSFPDDPEEEEITVDNLEEYYADFLTALDRADTALDNLKAAIARFLAVEEQAGQEAFARGDAALRAFQAAIERGIPGSTPPCV